ncbi:ictacalcin-like [Xyrichtys novacula]|uniref:Protein S100 n=1 Tax=Xyrichtys novacula TaxID=13765 RepID=A0AAV1HFZ1_XYRNO|nr:ictacalcin-like [Xyrichtys novacula]
MTDLTTAMCLIISTFQKYAGKEGDEKSLTKSELKELLQNEFGDLPGKASDKAAVDGIFDDLDQNKDKRVDFEEFGTLIISLTYLCYEFLKK